MAPSFEANSSHRLLGIDLAWNGCHRAPGKRFIVRLAERIERTPRDRAGKGAASFSASVLARPRSPARRNAPIRRSDLAPAHLADGNGSDMAGKPLARPDWGRPPVRQSVRADRRGHLIWPQGNFSTPRAPNACISGFSPWPRCVPVQDVDLDAHFAPLRGTLRHTLTRRDVRKTLSFAMAVFNRMEPSIGFRRLRLPSVRTSPSLHAAQPSLSHDALRPTCPRNAGISHDNHHQLT